MSGEKFPIWTAHTARRLAEFAHNGQKDKGGADYIGHPQRVADKVLRMGTRKGVDPIHALMTAYLHDVIEDTLITRDMLESLGCPEPVVDAVWALTRLKGESSDYYYAVIKRDPIALLVKEADIADNLDPARLARLGKETSVRLRLKYAKAKIALGLS